jgi:hypothetical protein
MPSNRSSANPSIRQICADRIDRLIPYAKNARTGGVIGIAAGMGRDRSPGALVPTDLDHHDRLAQRGDGGAGAGRAAAGEGEARGLSRRRFE